MAQYVITPITITDGVPSNTDPGETDVKERGAEQQQRHSPKRWEHVMTRDDLATLISRVRARYDALAPGARATLRRCATADELSAEGVFWRLVDDAGVPEKERHRMAHVVACFDAADAGGESFARWLRGTAYHDVKGADLPARAVRVRRLLASRDRDELVHQLRRLLRHGFQASRRGVDWGSLGTDIAFWGDGVRRSWAQDFFTSRPTTDASHPAETTHA